MAMRDLSEDIRQRLQHINAERGQLQARLRFLEETAEHLQKMLAYEEMRVRYEDSQASLPFIGTKDDATEVPRSTLAVFLQEELISGQTRSLEELKAAALARNIDFGNKHPGRVLHFALLGMQQGGSVEMVEAGLWRGKNQR